MAKRTSRTNGKVEHENRVGQAIGKSGARFSGRVPLAVVKKNGAGSRPAVEMAVLEWDTFLALVGTGEG